LQIPPCAMEFLQKTRAVGFVLEEISDAVLLGLVGVILDLKEIMEKLVWQTPMGISVYGDVVNGACVWVFDTYMADLFRVLQQQQRLPPPIEMLVIVTREPGYHLICHSFLLR